MLLSLYGKGRFARRIVIGEDGKPTAEMVMEDGSISTGPYDLIPILEDFIEEHPDFPIKVPERSSPLRAMKEF